MQLDWRGGARRTVAGLLYHGRAIRLLSRRRGNCRFILAYHRVVDRRSQDLSFVQPGMYVTAQTFEMHVRHLAKHYRVVPLGELLTMREGGACAITFDDGWRDNYAAAFPVLKAYGIPATIFLPTALIGTFSWPWPDRVCYYVHGAEPDQFPAALEAAWVEEVGYSFGAPVALDDRSAAAEVVVGRLKGLPHVTVQRVAARLDASFADLNGRLQRDRPWLTWNEAEEMSQHGVEFGSHTENHVILTKATVAEAQAEIVNSRAVLTAKLGPPPNAFCYPNGDYSPELARLVEEAGYRCAVTTRNGTVEDSPGPFELCRILLHDDISNTRALFACSLAGLGRFGRVLRKRSGKGS